LADIVSGAAGHHHVRHDHVWIHVLQPDQRRFGIA